MIIKRLFKKIINEATLNNCKRYIYSSSARYAYEGEGKTTMQFLSKDLFYGHMIQSIQPWGFQLNTGFNILGSMIIFPKSILAWNVITTADINEDTLILFKILEPKLDILVIGLEGEASPSFPDVQRLRNILMEWKIPHEILPVKHAISVYNFLNSDQKYVAGAMVLPKPKEVVLK